MLSFSAEPRRAGLFSSGRYDPRDFFLTIFLMAEGQPPEPNVQLLVDPVEPVVDPPVVNPLVVNPLVVNPPDGNQNVDVAQPQELEEVLF